MLCGLTVNEDLLEGSEDEGRGTVEVHRVAPEDASSIEVLVLIRRARSSHGRSPVSTGRYRLRRRHRQVPWRQALQGARA